MVESLKQNEKPSAAGVFLAGPKEKLEKIAVICNKILETRWEKADKAIGSVKKLLSSESDEIAVLCNSILEDRGKKSDKTINSFEKLLSQEKDLSKFEKRRFRELIWRNLSKNDIQDIDRIDFAHWVVCSIDDLITKDSQKNWSGLKNFDNVSNFTTKLMTQELRKNIETKVHKWLDNTPFETDLSTLKIESNSAHFKKAKKFLQQCAKDGLHFLIGIEPMSINSVLCGYGQTLGDFAFIYGGPQKGESIKETTIRIAKEEGAIDVADFFRFKLPEDNDGLYMIRVYDSVDIKEKDDGEPLVTLVGKRRIF